MGESLSDPGTYPSLLIGTLGNDNKNYSRFGFYIFYCRFFYTFTIFIFVFYTKLNVNCIHYYYDTSNFIKSSRLPLQLIIWYMVEHIHENKVDLSK